MYAADKNLEIDKMVSLYNRYKTSNAANVKAQKRYEEYSQFIKKHPRARYDLQRGIGKTKTVESSKKPEPYPEPKVYPGILSGEKIPDKIKVNLVVSGKIDINFNY
jgi:hypothetical protein